MRDTLPLMTVCVLFWSCSALPAPSTNRFTCGMDIKDIETVARSSSRCYSGVDDLNIYRTRGRYKNYLFYARKNGGLQYVANSQIWGLKEIRLSPLKSVCSGKLAFVVDISWTVALVGSAIWVDGVHVADAEAGHRIILGEGDHEIQLRKEGYLPLVKELTFTAQDRGDHRITFSAGELVPER